MAIKKVCSCPGTLLQLLGSYKTITSCFFFYYVPLLCSFSLLLLLPSLSTAKFLFPSSLLWKIFCTAEFEKVQVLMQTQLLFLAEYWRQTVSIIYYCYLFCFVFSRKFLLFLQDFPGCVCLRVLGEIWLFYAKIMFNILWVRLVFFMLE